jgi:hypothetical protein
MFAGTVLFSSLLIEWIYRRISRPGSRGYSMEQIRVLAWVGVIAVAVLPRPSSAWNIPGHMLSGIIAYQVLQQENPATFEKVKAVLEKHPWYANQWWARLQDVADHALVLFMQAGKVGRRYSQQGQAIPPRAVALHQLAV